MYAIRSYYEADWLGIPAYQRWKKEFASGEILEEDVKQTYVGYKGFSPAVGPSWLPIPSDYNSNSRPWFKSTIEKNGFTITSPYTFAAMNDQRMGVSIRITSYNVCYTKLLRISACRDLSVGLTDRMISFIFSPFYGSRKRPACLPHSRAYTESEGGFKSNPSAQKKILRRNSYNFV